MRVQARWGAPGPPQPKVPDPVGARSPGRRIDFVGPTYSMGAFSRGGLPEDKVRRSLRLFAEKVIPCFA